MPGGHSSTGRNTPEDSQGGVLNSFSRRAIAHDRLMQFTIVQPKWYVSGATSFPFGCNPVPIVRYWGRGSRSGWASRVSTLSIQVLTLGTHGAS